MLMLMSDIPGSIDVRIKGVSPGEFQHHVVIGILVTRLPTPQKKTGKENRLLNGKSWLAEAKYPEKKINSPVLHNTF